MPFLLLRDESSASLSALVESARNKVFPLQECDLQLNNAELEIISIAKTGKKLNSTSSDEGFESDIDTASIVSLDNESFNADKINKNDSKPNENDSANGSDNEAPESGTFEKSQEESDNKTTVIACSKLSNERFNLVDCMCYTDIKCNDILIFVIKKETFVFKFDDINALRSFYTKFTTLKAVANQKTYEGKVSQNLFNLQSTGNDTSHLPFKKKNEYSCSIRTGSKFMSINNPLDVTREYNDMKHNKQKESMSDCKYNTLSSNLNSEYKTYPKSSSIVDSLGLDIMQSSLVKENNMKVWNSAEDILDPPKRPQRKKKRKAPEPPAFTKEKSDVMSGQYVRVNVNRDSFDCVDSRVDRIGSSSNDIPKKNFPSMFNAKTCIKSLLKPKEKDILKYDYRVGDYYSLNRNAKTLNRSWNSSKFDGTMKPKPDFHQFVPIDYRHVDMGKSKNQLAFQNTQKGLVRAVYPEVYRNMTLSRNQRVETPVQNFSGRLFGLSSKLKDFSDGEGTKKSLWGSHSKKDTALKSVIKGNKEEASKKKNDKKVTFSTYTTVQVV